MKNVEMKALRVGILSLALAMLSWLPRANAVEFSTSAAEPVDDLLVSYAPTASGNLFQKTFAFRNVAPDSTTEGAQGTRGRGQTFLIQPGTASAYEVTAITLRVDVAVTTPSDGTLMLDVFEMDSNDPDALEGWTNGDGNKDNAILSGTGYRSMVSAVLPIAGGTTLAALSYLSFDFAPGELTFLDGKAYGFFVQYRLNDLTGVSSEVAIPLDTSSAGVRPAGVLISSFDVSNLSTSTQELIYYVQGVGSGDFRITELVYSEEASTVTITWTSSPGQFYAVKYSKDMSNWDSDFTDSIEGGAGETTTQTFDLSELGLENSEQLFVRVERQNG